MLNICNIYNICNIRHIQLICCVGRAP